jgi:hypothetical protein
MLHIITHWLEKWLHVKVTLDFWEEASYYDEDAKHDIIVGFLANEVYWKASKKV